MSHKSVSRGRRSPRKKRPSTKANFGKGRQLGYAVKQALDEYYSSVSHYNTRATHKQRAATFVQFCRRHGVKDARDIDREFVLSFGGYVRQRVGGEFLWPDGVVDVQVSVAYAHNLISTVNVIMRAFRGDNALKISGKEVLGVCRKSVRTREIQADVVDAKDAADRAIVAGFERGSAVILLARAWGMRVREAVLQDLDRMTLEIEKYGEAAILEGCKGGRMSLDRTIRANEFRLEALRFAIEVRPKGSKNLLSETGTVKSFLLQELNPCRLILKKAGVPTFQELRAGFAQDVYEEVIEGPSPLKQPIRDQIMDRIAREEVSRQLGHNRIGVASSYIGGTRHAA
ncbi:integrase [Marinobacter sp.]|uniref:integrase n=1 Tax=Marinobacter sp. TaxID=50741 RepID=UPI003A92BADE